MPSAGAEIIHLLLSHGLLVPFVLYGGDQHIVPVTMQRRRRPQPYATSASVNCAVAPEPDYRTVRVLTQVNWPHSSCLTRHLRMIKSRIGNFERDDQQLPDAPWIGSERQKGLHRRLGVKCNCRCVDVRGQFVPKLQAKAVTGLERLLHVPQTT